MNLTWLPLILWGGIITAGLSFGSISTVTLVTDLLRFLRVPLKVTLFVCWSEEHSARFIRKLLVGSRVPFIQARSDSVENVVLLDTMEPHQQLAVLDVDCPGTGAFLAAAQYRIYYRTRWMLFGNGSMVFDVLSSLHVTGNSEVYYFEEDPVKNGEIFIKNAYRRSLQAGIVDETIGIWRNSSIEDHRMGYSTSARRRNLQKLPLRTTLIYTDNYTLDHYDDYENPQIDPTNRLSYLITSSVYQFYLNATMEKRLANTWCYPDPTTGALMGLCLDLINNHSEVGTFMFLNDFRLKLMDYLPMPMVASLSFFYKTPKLSITNNIFRMPFDLTVWTCLLALVILIGIVLALMSIVSIKRKRRFVLQSKGQKFYDTIFEAIQIALQQGSLIDSKRATHRMAILFSVIGLMFLSVSFSAKIISLIQAPSEPINSLSELLESRLEVGALDIAYNRFMLSTSTEPVRKALYQHKMLRKDGSMNLYSLEEGVAKIRKGLFAFHVLGSSADPLISETFGDVEKCYLRTLNFLSGSVIFLTVQKNYTFREHLQMGLARVRETGVYSRDYQLFRMGYKPSCVKGIDFRPLDAVDLRFALQVIGGGLLGTIVILVAEIVWNRYRVTRGPLFEYVE